MLTLTWGIDILFKKLPSEIRDWIWKMPFEHYASGGGDLIQSLSSSLIPLVVTCTLHWLEVSIRFAQFLVRLLEKVQFKRCSLLCQWRLGQRGLPGGPGIGGIYVWCLVLVVIFIGLGGAEVRSGVKVIIWGRDKLQREGLILVGRLDPFKHHGSVLPRATLHLNLSTLHPNSTINWIASNHVAIVFIFEAIFAYKIEKLFFIWICNTEPKYYNHKHGATHSWDTLYTKMYLKPCQRYMIKLFAKIVSGYLAVPHLSCYFLTFNYRNHTHLLHFDL